MKKRRRETRPLGDAAFEYLRSLAKKHASFSTYYGHPEEIELLPGCVAMINGDISYDITSIRTFEYTAIMQFRAGQPQNIVVAGDIAAFERDAIHAALLT